MAPKRCAVSGCTFAKTNENLHYFRVPESITLRKYWEKTVGREFKKKHHVICEKHFNVEDILRKIEFIGPDGKVIAEDHLSRYRLKRGIFPTLFLQNKKHETDDQKQISSEIKLESNDDDVTLENDISSIETTNSDVENGLLTFLEPMNEEVYHENKIWPVESFKIIKIESLATVSLDDNIIPSEETNLITEIPVKYESIENEIFEQLSVSDLYIPPGWTKVTHIINNSKIICFCKNEVQFIEEEIVPVQMKVITVKDNLDIGLQIMQRKIDPFKYGDIEMMNSVENFQKFIFDVDSLKICQGITSKYEISNIYCKLAVKINEQSFRHINCTLIIASDVQTCNHCRRLETLQNMHQKMLNAQKREKRWKQELVAIKKEMMKLQRKMKYIEKRTLKIKMDEAKLKPAQREMIKQIFINNGKNGKKYISNWLLSCMLIFMKSPQMYTFLIDLNIIPLPCIKIITKFIDSRCGFDKEFQNLIKKYIDNKSLKEHDNLMLDNIDNKLQDCISTRKDLINELRYIFSKRNDILTIENFKEKLKASIIEFSDTVEDHDYY